MPKMKTNKAVKSKIKITATGKILVNKAGRRHLLTKKTSKRKRHMRRKEVVCAPETKNFKKRMGVVG